MRFRAQIPVVAWAALAAGAQLAASAAPQSRRLAIEQWGVEHGLPQNSVESLLQTRDGFLWVGTAEGLARFDGLRFRVFDRLRVPELPGDVINALLEDREGTVWIGTGHGLARHRAGVFERIVPPGRDSIGSVLALAEGASGAVWVGTRDSGLWRLMDGGFEEFGQARGLLDTNVLSLHAASSGRLWIGMRRGLQAFERGRFVTYGAAEGVPAAPVSAVLEHGEDVWIGTDGGGLVRLRDGQVRTFGPADGIKVPLVRALHADAGGALWIGTYGGGVIRLDQGRAASWTSREGLATDSVKCMALDREGGVFVGTGGGGLNRLRPASVTMLTAQDGLTSEVIRAVLEARDGSLWIATHGGGLNHFLHGRVRAFSRKDGLNDDVVFGLAEDGAGNLWVGTRRGLNVRRGERFVAAPYPGAPVSASVRSLYADTDGSLWAGTVDSGLFHLVGESFEQLGRAQGLSSDWITSVTRTRDGSLWVGTFGGGLNRVRDGRITAYGPREGLLSERVFAVHEDAEGVLWIATGGGGLSRLEGGRFSTWSRREGAPSNTFYWILEDAGHLWLSSHRGVFRVRKAALRDLAEGRRRSVNALALGKADGLLSLECNGGTQPAGVRDKGGRLLFPTLRGVALIAPDAVLSQPAPPQVVLEEIRADGRLLPLGGAVVVPAGPQRLEFAFTAPSFTAAHRLRFRYRLSGFDADWVEAGASREAQYTGLRPGPYELALAVGDVDEDFGETSTRVSLRVLPRFYETVLFRWVGLAAVLAAVWGGYHLRVRQLTARQRILSAMVEERTRSLKEAGDRLEERNRELQETIRVKDEVVSIVAHDIRSPLTVIQGYSELLQDRLTDADARQMLKDMLGSSQQIVALTGDMLTLSRIDAGALAPERRPMDLCALVRERALAHSAGGRVPVRYEDRGEPVMVEADPDRIGQVVDNLLSNAVKYSPEGGVVRVSVGAAGGDACVAVTDEGIGIPAEDLPRLFQKFSRLDGGRRRGIPGTGLGLYICRSFVEAHGGGIWVESRPGAGSVFRFSLPLAGPPG